MWLIANGDGQRIETQRLSFIYLKEMYVRAMFWIMPMQIDKISFSKLKTLQKKFT